MSSAKKLNEIGCRAFDTMYHHRLSYVQEEDALMDSIRWMFQHRFIHGSHPPHTTIRRLEIKVVIWKLRYLRAMRYGRSF